MSPSRGHCDAHALPEPGAGAVIRISPFSTIVSLPRVSPLRITQTPRYTKAQAHWTCGAQASPTVVRGSIRDQVATVVLPTA